MAALYNFYEILGITPKAEATEIKSAFRKLAMQYHPDKNPDPDAHKQFIAIHAAYETLSDPIKRRVYDLRRQTGNIIRKTYSSRQQTSTEKVAPEEMRRRYWASPAGQARRNELKKEAAFYDKLTLIFRILSIPIAVFLALMLYDTFYSKAIPNQPFKFLEKIELPKDRYYSIYQIGNDTLEITYGYERCLGREGTMTVYKGRIFQVVTGLEVQKDCAYLDDVFDPHKGVFSLGRIAVFLALIFVFTVWYKREKKYMIMGLGCFMILMCGIVLALLLALLP